MPAKKSSGDSSGRTSGVRTLGREGRAVKPTPAAGARASKALAAQARATLRGEFEHVLEMKDTLQIEMALGREAKGRKPRRPEEKLRSLIASLEGMNKFALQMGLITPAESREMYADAMKRGLYEGWR
ncbi:MAG: hypothetical protein WDA27_00245 [Actinomycetota bacterium]